MQSQLPVWQAPLIGRLRKCYRWLKSAMCLLKPSSTCATLYLVFALGNYTRRDEGAAGVVHNVFQRLGLLEGATHYIWYDNIGEVFLFSTRLS